MAQISSGATDALNTEVLRRFAPADASYVPEDRITEAYAFATKAREQLQKIADAVEVLTSVVGASAYADAIVSELTRMHATELDKLSGLVARAVARKDEAGQDARYGDLLQQLADRFRS